MYANYKKLDLYKNADELVLLIYKYTRSFPKEEVFGLVSQMRRAAVSVVANLAEGYGRQGVKEKIQFYHISIGSLNELEYYIGLSFNLGYINQEQHEELSCLQVNVSKLFSGYLKGLKKNTLNLKTKPTTYNLQPTNYQQGLTLIETVVALFVLVTGLSAGLGLAISSFSATNDIVARITAVGYAKEGTEAVRMMRDTNWMQDEIADCPDIGGLCYPDWLTELYDISPAGGGPTDHRLDIPSFQYEFSLEEAPPSPPPTYYQLRFGLFGNNRMVRHTGSGTSLPFYRKVTLEFADIGGDYSPLSPLLLVRSTVWWHGRGCNNSITNLTDPGDTSCKVIVEDYLTNWRDY